jgi:DNA repair exonuclease SbcCD ATPase subunit
LQKRDILNAGAQSYRRNYLLGLLKNFSQVYDVLATQEGALGYSQKENARTMESYSKKVQQLHASYQELVMSLGQEGGLLDILKGVVDAVRGGIQAWNDLGCSAQRTILGILKGFAEIKIASMVMKKVIGEGFGEMFANPNAELKIVGTVKQLISNYGGVLPFAAMWVGIPAAVMAATYAIQQYNKHAMRLQQTYVDIKYWSEKYIAQFEDEAKVYQQNALTVDKLSAKYRELEKQRTSAAQNGADVAALQQYAAQQDDIVSQIEEALGRETAARLKAASFSEEASKIVKDAEKAKADALGEDVKKQVDQYKKLMLEEIENAKVQLATIEAQTEGWESYLMFTDRVKYEFAEAIAIIKKGWWNLLSDAATVQAKLDETAGNFFDKIGADSMAKKYLDAAAEKYAEAYNYSAEARFGVEKELQAKADKLASEPLKRTKDTLRNLYSDLAKLRESTSGSSGPATNQGVTSTPEGDAKAAATAIVDKVEALKAEADATTSLITIVKSRISYNTREKASVDELAQADKDRAQLLTLINQRQGELATIAQASRDSIDTLRAAQSKLNRSTQEGNSAWEDMENKINSLIKLSGTNANPLGSLSEEWWNLQADKDQIMEQDNANSTMAIRNLKTLKESYDKGLLPLNSYVDALGRLESQAGLTANAINEINIEQGSALLKKWTNELETALDSGDKALKKFGDDLDAIFTDASKSGKGYDASTLTNTLRNNLSSLKGTYSLPANTLQSAQNTTKGMIGDILNGKFAINSEALLKLDRTQFLSAVEQGKNDLVTAGKSVNDLIIAIGNERAGVIRDIEGQIKPIQDTLDKFAKWEKQDNSKQLQDTMNDSLNKLYGKTEKVPGLPTVSQLKHVVGSIKVDDLGALSPDKFASVMQQNMESLRQVSTTTKNYLDAVSKNFKSQIDAVDAQILKVDADLNATLTKLQKELDKLDQQNTDNQRDKETTQYQTNRKAITDEIAWRMQREDLYYFEIAAKKQELAKLDQDWAQKQRDWQNEDAKKSIQQQMDDARTAAEERKSQLEAEKRQLEEQKALWESALNSVLSYVNGQISGLKEIGQERINTLTNLKETKSQEYDTLLEALGNVQKFVNDQIAAWQSLSDQRKAIESDTWDNEKNGIRAVMNNGALNVMADMTAKGLATGQNYVDSIIQGVNSRRDALQDALDSLTRTTNAYQQAQTTTTTTTMSVPQMINGRYAMADGAYVKARPGVGVRAIVGEGKYDEIVQPVNTIQPMIDKAVITSLRSFGGAGAPMSRSDYADMLNATVQAIASAFPDSVEAKFILPDGVVQRQVIKLFKDASFGHAVHAS